MSQLRRSWLLVVLVDVACGQQDFHNVTLSTGVTLEYYVKGPADGSVLILLHGWPDSLHSFDLLAPLLDPRLRVYAMSQRGFGRSDKPFAGLPPADSTYSILQYATDVRAFMAAVGINCGEASLAGHSMGSLIAHQFAVQYPQCASKLVLIDSCKTGVGNEVLQYVQDEMDAPGFVLDQEYTYAFQTSTIYDLSAVPGWFVNSIVQNSMLAPEYVWRAGLQAILIDDHSDQLASVSAPTLIIVGEHDELFPGEQCAVTMPIPQQRVAVLPNAGHSPVWDTPQLVAAEINGFLLPPEPPALRPMASPSSSPPVAAEMVSSLAIAASSSAAAAAAAASTATIAAAAAATPASSSIVGVAAVI